MPIDGVSLIKTTDILSGVSSRPTPSMGHRGAPCTGWVKCFESYYHASGGACLQATPGAARGASGNPVGLGGVL